MSAIYRLLGCAALLWSLTAQAQVTYQFDLPSQLLAESLRTVARQTSTNIIFESATVEHISAPALRGRLTAAQAIEKLLAGTGLNAQRMPDEAVIVQRGPAQPSAAAGEGASSRSDRRFSVVQLLSRLDQTRSAMAGQQASGAQENPAAGREPHDSKIGEVIVTARFREESAQDVGQSIRAFSAREIERAGIVDFEDIARRTSGLSFNDRGPNRNEASIRGMSPLANGAVLDILPSQTVVRQFVDDIPVSSPNSSQRDFSLFDFNRVEVLRGPQPTYFGEGSLGGTIRYFSEDPQLAAPTVGGKAALDVSTTDGGGANYSVNAAANFVLVPDKFAVRVVGFRRDDDGFIDNTLTGDKDFNSYRSTGGRVVVKAQPTDRFALRFAAHLVNDDVGGDWLADNAGHDYRNSANVFQSDTDIDEYRLYSLKMSYDFGPVTLTSVTGKYERERRNRVFDFTQARNSLPVLYGLNGTVITENLADEDNFTQELRLVSQFGGRFNFTAGALYQDAKYIQTAEAHSPQMLPISLVGSDLFFGSLDAPPSTRKHKSAFLELSFAATERLKLIGGVRWVDETQRSPQGGTEPGLAVCVADADGTPPFGGLGNPCLATVLVDSNTLLAGIGATGVTEVVNKVDGEFLPKLAAEFRATDDVLLFASAAKGIRNGGINSIFVLTAAEIDRSQLGFDQDELRAYELGIKSRLLGGSVLLNATTYYNDWSDIQVLLSTSAGSLFVNAPHARSTGLELESLWRASERLDLFANVGYIKAEFTEQTVLNTPESQAILQFLGLPPQIIRKGMRLPNVPEWTFSAGLDWHFPLRVPDLGIRARVDYQYSDARFIGAVNNPARMLDSYGIGNVRVGLEGRTWAVTGYVSNVTNEIAAQARLDVGGTAPLFYINRPRTFGLNFTKSFD